MCCLQELKDLENEIKLLKGCRHERIVQYFGVVNKPHEICIFLELMTEVS
jgi:hypothetical protein